MSILDIYQKTLRKTIDFTITYDVLHDVKMKLLNSLLEVGYSIVDFHKPEITEEIKSKNQNVYASIDTSLYLRLSDGKLEPLFLDGEDGTHFMMDEGTNSVVVSLQYEDLCKELGISKDSDIKTVETMFNNAFVKAVEDTKKEALNFNSYKIIYMKNFLKNTETVSFSNMLKKLPLDFKTKLPELKNLVNSEIIKYLKSHDTNSVDFKVDIVKTNFEYDKDNKKGILELGLVISNIIDNKMKKIAITDYSLELGSYNFEYNFSEDESKRINDLLKKTFNDLLKEKSNQIDSLEIEISPNETKSGKVYYITPEIKRNLEIVGDESELKELVTNIFNFCKSGAFLRDSKYIKNYKTFFKLSENKNGYLKIITNANSKENFIELALGANGITILNVGGNVKTYLEKNNIDVNNITYLKGKPSALSLDAIITIMNGLSKQIVWEGILGFYDGRTTLKSATEKAEKLISESNPAVEKIRKKYKLPRNVNINPDIEIVGDFHGIPMLKGSSEDMIVIFGLNGSNSVFISKEEILNNKEEFKAYGFKE